MKAFTKRALRNNNINTITNWRQQGFSLTNKDFIERDLKYVAHNYGPLPVTITKAQGLYMWDVEGKKYMDFLCGYSAVNQGHCHPKILKALQVQAKKVTMTSRAFYNDQLGPFAEYICKLLGYDKFLPMNGGVEACETAIKLARRWGYEKKGIPDNQAEVLLAKGCFWGRTITASGGSDDPQRYTHFGPFTPGFTLIDYNDVNVVRSHFENNKNICAIMLEPIQGENGVIVPAKGYLAEIHKLCKQHNVLLIADEIQTGFGRTGKLMCYEWDSIKPDLVCMGKAMSGGMMPVSGVVCNDEIMMTLKPGDHGSTYGGNPLGMAVAKAAIETLIEEGMVENSQKMGEIFEDQLSKIKSSLIKEQRGRGLFRAIEIVQKKQVTVNGNDLGYALLKRNILTKATHDSTIRLAPPLIIKEKELMKACRQVKHAVREIEKVNRANKKK